MGRTSDITIVFSPKRGSGDAQAALKKNLRYLDHELSQKLGQQNPVNLDDIGDTWVTTAAELELAGAINNLNKDGKKPRKHHKTRYKAKQVTQIHHAKRQNKQTWHCNGQAFYAISGAQIKAVDEVNRRLGALRLERAEKIRKEKKNLTPQHKVRHTPSGEEGRRVDPDREWELWAKKHFSPEASVVQAS